ncbi:MAG: hypothetical protein J4G17_05395 [Anaerolineae bacterium]|nr:hypothetical protein [Anaerolineae bacterium]
MPDTIAYLYLGLAAIAFILLLFVVSMLMRRRNLEQDHRVLDQLERGD